MSSLENMNMAGSHPENGGFSHSQPSERHSSPSDGQEKKSIERELKQFEVLLFLKQDQVSPSEMEKYQKQKKDYADKYLGGNEPDRLITSIDELKRALAQIAPPKSFDDDVAIMRERNQKLIEEDSEEEWYKRDMEDPSHGGSH